jgi:IS605 OrfB family transposase
MTVASNSEFTTFTQKQNVIRRLYQKIALLKSFRVRKKQIVKKEKRMDNIVTDIHYKVINKLIEKNDVIFYGDIKSHDIVKKATYNKTLKKDTNSLKFFQLKTRLLYKAKMNGNKVFPVNEAFTTKTCSTCGKINNPENSKIYTCTTCDKKVGRDEDAARCILMKGLIQNNFFK